MNVDYLFGKLTNKLRRKDAHVADEDYEIDLFCFELLCELFVEFLARFVLWVDREGFVALFLCSLNGVAVFVRDYE